MNTYAKLRKDELIALLQEAEARPQTTWGDAATLVGQSISAVSRELPLFVKDCQRLADWLKECGILLVETYRKPILKQPGT